MRFTPTLRNQYVLGATTAKPSPELTARVRRTAFLHKLRTADELAPLFKRRSRGLKHVATERAKGSDILDDVGLLVSFAMYGPASVNKPL
ncbi:hypothetical protein D9619_003816 [Psilocybe cf. subviscida]|uniref:Uncharacterized protein n=1 Tax=Psilocybe cf. subviscida TaxID=2480587 RepID=A0A8H5AXJ6_9AGAR|nr:hypothetical protein D9619_003816 [Psilocybe cf. subviscida]